VAARAARPPRPAPAGQHFLGRRTATDLVRRARIRAGDLVVELGAGRGILTREIAERAARVLAVELDARLARRLRLRFADVPNVEIVHADALRIAFPDRPFRAVGNVPFGIANALLRRLVDERELLRADLVVQEGVARKRAATPPRSLRTLSWAPWWRFERGQRIPAHLFRPEPRCDAAVLIATRRSVPLVADEERSSYLRLLDAAFSRAGEPLSHLRSRLGARSELRGALHDAGLTPRDRAVDLDVEQFVALLRALRAHGVNPG
jgi:23S rRNA (adenine-N6)-dimethyltransferase